MVCLIHSWIRTDERIWLSHCQRNSNTGIVKYAIIKKLVTHILHKGNLNVRHLKGPSENVPFHLNKSKKTLTSETKCVKKILALEFINYFLGHFCFTFYTDKNLNMKVINIYIRTSWGFFSPWNKTISLFLISTVWLSDTCLILSDPW